MCTDNTYPGMAWTRNTTDAWLALSNNLTEPVNENQASFADLKQFPEFLVAFYLNQYYLRVLCALGVLCNAAVFLTISRIKPFTTSSFYVAFLAVVDTLALIIKLIYMELTREIALGDAGCKSLLFIGNFFVQYANWVLVIMTVERFIAVWFPLKAIAMSTMTKAKISLFISAFLLAIFNLHFLWTFEEHDDGKKPECGPTREHEEFIATVWPWLDGCVFALGPCVLLIVPNGLIIYSVRRALREQKAMTSAGGAPSSHSNRQTQLTVMLVTVAVAFVCFLLPGSVFFIVSPYWKRNSLHQTAQYLLANQIVFFLADCNHAINFFFFFLGGRKFRQMFLDMLCCDKRKKQQPSTASTLTALTPSTSRASFASSNTR